MIKIFQNNIQFVTCYTRFYLETLIKCFQKRFTYVGLKVKKQTLEKENLQLLWEVNILKNPQLAI